MSARTLLGSLLVLAALAASCATVPDRTGTPQLPPDFDKVVPNARFHVFSYLNQGEPILISLWGTEDSLLSALGYPSTAEVDNLTAWAGFYEAQPVLAVRVDLTNPHLIPLLIHVLEEQNREDLWLLQQGDVLNVVLGTGPEAETYRQVMEMQDYIALEDAAPAVWNSMRALPSEPPMPAIGVGYMNITDKLVESILLRGQETGDRGVETLARLKPLLDRTGIKHGVFGIYGPPLPTLHAGMDITALQAQAYSSVMVLDSKIPPFVLDFIFDAGLEGSGVERLMVDGRPAYSAPTQDVQTLFRREGSAIVLSAGMDRKVAQDALTTITLP